MKGHRLHEVPMQAPAAVLPPRPALVVVPSEKTGDPRSAISLLFGHLKDAVRTASEGLDLATVVKNREAGYLAVKIVKGSEALADTIHEAVETALAAYQLVRASYNRETGEVTIISSRVTATS